MLSFHMMPNFAFATKTVIQAVEAVIFARKQAQKTAVVIRLPSVKSRPNSQPRGCADVPQITSDSKHHALRTVLQLILGPSCRRECCCTVKANASVFGMIIATITVYTIQNRATTVTAAVRSSKNCRDHD